MAKIHGGNPRNRLGTHFVESMMIPKYQENNIGPASLGKTKGRLHNKLVSRYDAKFDANKIVANIREAEENMKHVGT